MAEPTFRPGIDATRGLTRGIGIGQEAQRIGLQRQQQQFTQGQVLEQRKVEEAERIRKQKEQRLLGELQRYENVLKGLDVANQPGLTKRLIDRSNKITDELFPGSVNIDADYVIRNAQDFQKDLKARDLMEKEFGEGSPEVMAFSEELINKYSTPSARIEQIVEETGEKRAITRELAKEERGFGRQKDIIELTARERAKQTELARTESEKAATTKFTQEKELLKMKEKPPKVREPKIQMIGTGEMDLMSGLEKKIPMQVITDDEGNIVGLKRIPIIEEEAEPLPKEAFSPTIETQKPSKSQVSQSPKDIAAKGRADGMKRRTLSLTEFRTLTVQKAKADGTPVPSEKEIRAEYNRQRKGK
jgi:hypothetical protein